MDQKTLILDLEYLRQDSKLQKLCDFVRQRIQQGRRITVADEEDDEFESIQDENSILQPHTEVISLIYQEKFQSEISLEFREKKDEVIPTTPQVISQFDHSQSLQNQTSIKLSEKSPFIVSLKKNFAYCRLREARKLFENGKLTDAVNEAKGAYNYAAPMLFGTMDNKQLNKQYALIGIESLCLLATIYRALANFDEAIKNLRQCLKNFKIHDIVLLGRIYIELGNLNLQQMQLDQAQVYYYDALLIYEKASLKIEIAQCLLNLSQVNAITKNIDVAKKLCYEGVNIYRSSLLSDDDRLAEAYYFMGFVFYCNKDYEFSLAYLKQSIQIKNKMQRNRSNYPQQIWQCSKGSSIIYLIINEPEQAINFFEAALIIFKQMIICAKKKELKINPRFELWLDIKQFRASIYEQRILYEGQKVFLIGFDCLQVDIRRGAFKHIKSSFEYHAFREKVRIHEQKQEKMKNKFNFKIFLQINVRIHGSINLFLQYCSECASAIIALFFLESKILMILFQNQQIPKFTPKLICPYPVCPKISNKLFFQHLIVKYQFTNLQSFFLDFLYYTLLQFIYFQFKARNIANQTLKFFMFC